MVDDIIQAVKAKKELSTLDNSFVREKVEKILRSDNRIKEKYESAKNFSQFTRSKEYKALLKAVRKELRVVYGVFQEGDARAALESGVPAVLQTHTSTRERIPYYGIICKELADRIPQPKTILDLGCGLNPLADSYFRERGWKVHWVASDISSADMKFLEEAFARFDIDGETTQLDLVQEYEKIPKADVVFLWKLLDSLEEIERHISYKIFENIEAKWIVVSFPTKSLGGKKTISSRGRVWFERLLKRKNCSWESFRTPNELFYVISL